MVQHPTNNVNTNITTRRKFIRQSVLAGAAYAACPRMLAAAVADSKPKLPEPNPARLPRWRGFNLLEKFTHNNSSRSLTTPHSNPPFVERDFEWMAAWGFNFARLPLSYRCWASPEDWLNLSEPVLKEIDRAVTLGQQYGIHVNINFHRAPGYCVNPPAEPLDLFKDEKALDASAFHWAHFAKRYRSIPNANVSFDLLNEPKDIPPATYERVVRRLVEAIRAEDPKRLIIADGLSYGNKPVPGLASLSIAQSTRGYQPGRISHYKASWAGGMNWPEPTWPLTIKAGDVWDKDRLRREQIEPWKALEKLGVGVHVGEWGAFRFTPHKVVLAWMRDYLELWKEAGWGWSMWNLRGAFGPVDSGRADVRYEDFQGHKLDREMLELIRAF